MPPRDAAERVTFATWAIVTGKSPGGIFNALPTIDDATAAKMAERLTERAEGTITAEDVTSAPDHRGAGRRRCASYLEAGKVDGFVRIIRARPQAEGQTKIPVFVFHAAGGSTVVYEPLLKRLPADTPMYGIERVEGSIEERAAEYVPKLMEISGNGPFILAGWSLGGVLAYACAIGLKQAGADVRFVGLIDAVRPGEEIPQTKEETRARWDRYARFAERTFNVRGPADPLRATRGARRRGSGEVRAGRRQRRAACRSRAASSSTSARRIWTSGRIDTAEIQPYDGHVTLYMADRYHDDAIYFEPALRHPQAGRRLGRVRLRPRGRADRGRAHPGDRRAVHCQGRRPHERGAQPHRGRGEAGEVTTKTTAELLAELREKLELAKEPGGEKAIAKRAKKGIPSARARIHALLDPGSFLEIGALAKTPGDPEALYGDGVVTGHGTINGRPVGVFSHDQTVFQGSVGEMFGRKVAKLMEWVAMVGCPIIGINDSAGARIQDAVTSLAWYAELGRRHEMLRGLVPEISLILGKCAGGAVYSPIQTDLVVAVRDQGYMFVTGPDVIKDVTGEDVTLDELGGADEQAQLRQHPPGGRGRGGGVPVRARLPELPARQHLRRRADRQPGSGAGDHAARLRTRLDRAGHRQHGLRHARDPAADLRRRRRLRGRRAARPGDDHRVRPRRRPTRSA